MIRIAGLFRAAPAAAAATIIMISSTGTLSLAKNSEGGSGAEPIAPGSVERSNGPYDEATRLHLAAIWLQNAERFEDAKEAYSQALDIDPSRVTTLIGLAQLYATMGENALGGSTLARVEELLDAVPYDLRARHHAVVGETFIELDEAERAQPHIAAAKRLANEFDSNPLRARALIAEAMASSQVGDFGAARRHFDAAERAINKIDDETSEQPLRYLRLSELAEHEMAAGSYEDAYATLATLQRHIGNDNPNLSVQIAHKQGKALMAIGRLDEAALLLQGVAEAYTEMFGPNHGATQEVQRDLSSARGDNR